MGFDSFGIHTDRGASGLNHTVAVLGRLLDKSRH